MKHAWADRLVEIPSWWRALAMGLARRQRLPIETLEQTARQLLEVIAFVRLAEDREGEQANFPSTASLAAWYQYLRERWGTACFQLTAEEFPDWSHLTLAPEVLAWLRESMQGEAWETVPPPELLGQIHQSLLGYRLVRKVGELCAESNAGARKRAGVFYTPPYVTRYIVQTVLGPTLQESEATGQHRGELRLLDPACGCGAFLCEVQRQLGPEPGHVLLHGVDLDPEAVLVTRRALWLNQATVDWARSICRGNVLLESPWDQETSFDVILGNPPYRRELHTKHLLDPIHQTDWGERYRAPRMDYWYYFLHRGLELLRPGGRLAFIVGAYWTAGSGAGKLIKELRQSAQIDEIALLEDAPVFEGVAGRHLIVTLTKAAPTRRICVKRPPAGTVPDAEALLTGQQAWEHYEKTPQQLFRAGRIDLEPPADALLARLAVGTPLSELGEVRQGIAENPATINRGTNERFGRRWSVGEGVFALTRQELDGLALSEQEQGLIRPYYDLCDLARYELAERPSRHLIYATGQTWLREGQHPALAAHLARFRPIMEERRETRRGLRGWWQLHWPREESLWEADKILSVQMGTRPSFVPARGSVYVPFSVNVFIPAAETREHLYYLTAVLNSRLLWKWYQHHAKRRGVGLEINVGVLTQSPIRRIDFDRADDVARHDRIVKLVTELLSQKRVLRQSSTAAMREMFQRQVDALERALDQAIYSLYELSPGEIALVERGTGETPLP